MIRLKLNNVSWQTKGYDILNGVSFEFSQGELIALLGPNGAGKTSLLRCALGMETSYSGNISINGQSPRDMSANARARLVSYLPQTRPIAWPITVADTVALGRFAHGVRLGKLHPSDAKAVAAVIEACNLQHLQHRRVDTLSGGELARVHCARAFVAHAPLLLADEPIVALDPKHQYKVMALIRDYVNAGGGALIVLHDVELAARFADRLVWLKAGAILADGTPIDTFTQQRMAEVYGVTARIGQLDDYQTLSILGVLE